jgi:hypothetical protein
MYFGGAIAISYQKYKHYIVERDCISSVHLSRIDYNKYYYFPNGLIERFSFASAYKLIHIANNKEIDVCVEKGLK